MSQNNTTISAASYFRLPPIVTTESDRVFMRDVNAFIDYELNDTNREDQEQRYLVYKAVLSKVIEHVTSYKPVLTRIQKEYEDTIEAIKNDQQETAYLQGKLRAMTSEPSTLINYKRRVDELEERVASIKKENGRLQKELCEIQTTRIEKENRPPTMENANKQMKKDIRSIPGLSLEKTTDMKVLQKKYEALDRQLKEINNSLRTRFLPKTHKVKLKETLDSKVASRDHLLWQSQVYKAKVQKLKIALEAAEAYNQVKPPHQTVGDAVTLAFQQASGMLKAEREKAEGEQAEVSQTTAHDDDDPEMEQEAEMMLEYIEKFNEQFEDGFYEEAAIHAANSPKGILRTQATLAKFRDVKIKGQGRSPLLAFCDVMMSTVKAAGRKPDEALSRECVEAGLKENRSDLVYHWLAQDRLTISYQLGKMIAEHCTCPIPCLCGCQAMAQNIFVSVNAHEDAILAMLKQEKVYSTLQYARIHSCISSENIKGILGLSICQDFVNGLMEGDLSGKKPYLNVMVGKILLSLAELNKPELATNLLCAMLNSSSQDRDSKLSVLSLQRAVALDRVTTRDQWLTIVQFLSLCGQQEISLQLLALTTVLNVIGNAWSTVQEDRKAVSFSLEIETCSDSVKDDSDDSSFELSSRSRESNSYDQSSREMSPESALPQRNSRQSILKKVSEVGSTIAPDFKKTLSTKTTFALQNKRVVHASSLKSSLSEGRQAGGGDDQDNSTDHKRAAPKAWGGIRFMDNDPYTSNPESAEDSETE